MTDVFNNQIEADADFAAFKEFWAREFGGHIYGLNAARTAWQEGQRQMLKVLAARAAKQEGVKPQQKQEPQPRYKVVEGSQTSHCCFAATVVDTEQPVTINGKHFNGLYEPVCECVDKADAEQICRVLNRSAE